MIDCVERRRQIECQEACRRFVVGGPVNVIEYFEDGRFSVVVFPVCWLECVKTGYGFDVSSDSAQKQLLDYFWYGAQIRDRTVVDWLGWIQVIFLEQWSNLCSLEFLGKRPFIERQSCQTRNYGSERVYTVLEKRCRNDVQRRRFTWHGMNDFLTSSMVAAVMTSNSSPMYCASDIRGVGAVPASFKEMFDFRSLIFFTKNSAITWTKVPPLSSCTASFLSWGCRSFLIVDHLLRGSSAN